MLSNILELYIYKQISTSLCLLSVVNAIEFDNASRNLYTHGDSFQKTSLHCWDLHLVSYINDRVHTYLLMLCFAEHVAYIAPMRERNATKAPILPAIIGVLMLLTGKNIKISEINTYNLFYYNS